MKCVDCGCTYEHACLGFDGQPCHWASTNPPVCSTCDDKRALKAAVKVLRRNATELQQGETVSGKWPKGREHVRDECRGLRALARRLAEISAKAGP